MSENQICINFKYLLGDSFNKVTEKEKKKKDREGGKEGKGKRASPGNKHMQTRNPTSEASISVTFCLYTCTQMPSCQSSWEKLQSPTSTTPRPNKHQDVGGSDGKEGSFVITGKPPELTEGLTLAFQKRLISHSDNIVLYNWAYTLPGLKDATIVNINSMFTF